MAEEGLDPRRRALDVFLQIKSRLDELEEKLGKEHSEYVSEVRKKLRTRSRNMPELMIDLGLAPTLTFCLAKASKDNLNKACILMDDGVDSFISSIKSGDKLSVEDLSYALYAYVILKYLKELGIRRNGERIAVDARKVDSIYELLKALTRGTTLLNLLTPYLTEFKKLCEAEFPSER
ncbi:MAG: type III-B CRISPR module-associated protein Cmr5 [Thermoprotei archaeon]|nr:MAG: type III-B CRISPR module-associated protein Cmr5 [Thermoprotei archaeon]